MADTVGDMIDKLTIANIKLWHIEDERRAYVADTESYTAQCSALWEERAKGAEELLKKVASVNKERNSLIDQINAALKVLVDKASNNESGFSVDCEGLLGTGKNKFYKGEDHK